MEVTALCIRLSLNVLFLLCGLNQKVGSVFLRVVPNRQQFFEYESLTVHCEGLKGEQLSCRTTRKLGSTGSSCNIKNVFPDDSGEYWCETGALKRSNGVHITVTTGSVILESPALPVAEGDAVTLSCRNKTTTSNITADFYKDGLLLRSSSPGNINILSVSKSDEGLYKCRIPDCGESAESWLIVRETSPTASPTSSSSASSSPTSSSSASSSPTSSSSTSSSSAPWIVVTVLLMVLLLAVGLLHFGKGYWHRALLYLSTLTLGPGSAEDQAVSVEVNAADADKVTYAVVKKKRKKKDEDALMCQALYYTLGPGDTQHLAEPSASTNPSLKEDSFYSTIGY